MTSRNDFAHRPDGQRAMYWVAHVAGNFYVADNGSNTITGYHIDSAGTPTVFTQANTRVGPIDLTGTHDGQFLYVEVGTTGGVDGYRINPDGTLTQIATRTVPNSAEGIAVN
jgi:6-phosphogluconolactonase (cycloisomerase 2 family)